MNIWKIAVILIFLSKLCISEETPSFLTNKYIYLNTTAEMNNSAGSIYLLGIRPMTNYNGAGFDFALINDDGDRGILLDMSYKKNGKYIGYKGIFGGIYITSYYDNLLPIVLNTFSLGKMDRLYVSCTLYFHIPLFAGIRYEVPKLPLTIGLWSFLLDDNFIFNNQLSFAEKGFELQYSGKKYFVKMVYFINQNDNNETANENEYLSFSIGMNLQRPKR